MTLNPMPTYPIASNRLNWLEVELQRLKDQHLLRQQRVRESPHVGGQVQLKQSALINFSSNDYLSLAADARLVQAAILATGQVGWGSGASPMVSGYGIWHWRLEQEIAKLKGTEAALLCTTGYAANQAAIGALMGKGDAIFSDALNHASIIDGCRLSGAEVKIYRHSDWHHLEQLLVEHTDHRRRLIVTDSLFSMDGDLAPLTELSELAQRHQAMLMVDEAHATGVFGYHGGGLVEQQQVERNVDVHVGTLSKALGSFGGFVAGSRQLIEWVRHRGRAYFFSTAQPEPIAAASLAAIQIVRDEPDRRKQLLDKATWLRQQLSAAGFNIGPSESQIIPVILGTADETERLSLALADQGLWVPAIRPPTVPEGTSRLRISLNYAHTSEHLQKLLSALQSHAL